MHDEFLSAGERQRALTACHDCDMLVGTTPAGEESAFKAYCPRCGALLYRHDREGLEDTLALAFAGLVLLVVGNAFPVVGLNIQGQRIDTTVVGAAIRLWNNDMPAVSVLMLATTTLIPFLEMAGLIWLLLPLQRGKRPPAFAAVVRGLQAAHAWAMVEVFILGILVALVKLSHLAEVLLGPGMMCFGSLMLLLTTLSASFEPRELWQAWERGQ